jgi:hypothetical protein
LCAHTAVGVDGKVCVFITPHPPFLPSFLPSFSNHPPTHTPHPQNYHTQHNQIDLRRLEAERQGMSEEQLKEQIEAKLLADKVLDFLAEHADITWVDAKEL